MRSVKGAVGVGSWVACVAGTGDTDGVLGEAVSLVAGVEGWVGLRKPLRGRASWPSCVAWIVGIAGAGVSIVGTGRSTEVSLRL